MPVCRPVGQALVSVLIVSLEIISVLMVSVLIGGGRMMRVRGIDPPGRALGWSEMVRTPQTNFFLCCCCIIPPQEKAHES